MDKTQSGDYFKGGLAFGLGVGAFVGTYGALWLNKNHHISPDKVLSNVRDAFLTEGPIEGSWIEATRKPTQKFAITQELYRGGISRLEDGKLVSYEFAADAKTGTVLEITRL